jgi:hypothetical protein
LSVELAKASSFPSLRARSAEALEPEALSGIVYAAMEFCEERDNPNKGGTA